MLDHLLEEKLATLDSIEHLLSVLGATELGDHRLDVLDGELFKLESLEKLLRVTADVTRDHHGFITTIVCDLVFNELDARVRLLDTSDLAFEDVGDLDLIGHIIWFLVVVVFDSDVTDRKDSRRLCVFGQHYFLVT